MEQREFIVEAEAAGQRIDRFLSGEDTGLSRSALQGLVADGRWLLGALSGEASSTVGVRKKTRQDQIGPIVCEVCGRRWSKVNARNSRRRHVRKARTRRRSRLLPVHRQQPLNPLPLADGHQAHLCHQC